jgi:hypothetical protein
MHDDIKKLGKTIQLTNGALTRVDIDSDHFYFITEPTLGLNGAFCIGLTTVLDVAAPFPIALRDYLRNTTAEESSQNMESKRQRGQDLHDALDRLANGVAVSGEEFRTTYEKDALVTFIQFMRFLQPLVFKTERVVLDPALRVAGTLDFAGIVDERRLDILLEPNKYLDRDKNRDFTVKEKFAGLLEGPIKPVKVVIDWKFTGRSNYNHKVQVAGYAEMYRNSYKDEQPIERKLTWRFSPQHKFRFDMQESLLSYESFTRIYETCIEYLGKFPEPPVIVVYPDKFKLFDQIPGRENITDFTTDPVKQWEDKQTPILT